MSVVLEARRVSRIHETPEGEITALAEFSFSAGANELIAVTGPSGAGKSTLINILSTLDSPTTGRVYYNGRDLFDSREYDIAEVRNSAFGFIFQTPYLLLDRTVLENVSLPFLYGTPVSAQTADSRCMELLDYVGLAEFAGRYPQSLSGGEMQRVVFARAMVRRPQVIFADEPTGSLDTDNSHRILSLLKSQAESGCTVIMVTHDNNAVAYGDRTVKLQKPVTVEIPA